MATTYWYPGKSLPLYLKGGLGYIYTSIGDCTTIFRRITFAFQVGTGHDLKITQMAITFYANWIKGSAARSSSMATPSQMSVPSLLQIGAAFWLLPAAPAAFG